MLSEYKEKQKWSGNGSETKQGNKLPSFKYIPLRQETLRKRTFGLLSSTMQDIENHIETFNADPPRNKPLKDQLNPASIYHRNCV